MKHKWDSKITKKVPYTTCERCGLVKSAQYPFGYVYWSESGNIYSPHYAPTCNGKILNEVNDKQDEKVCVACKRKFTETEVPDKRYCCYACYEGY